MGKENLAAFAPAGPEITGYEVWQRPNDTGYVMVLLISNYSSPTPHRYKVQYTPQGRPFVRPSGYRLYLDGMV